MTRAEVVHPFSRVVRVQERTCVLHVRHVLEARFCVHAVQDCELGDLVEQLFPGVVVARLRQALAVERLHPPAPFAVRPSLHIRPGLLLEPLQYVSLGTTSSLVSRSSSSRY